MTHDGGRDAVRRGGRRPADAHAGHPAATYRYSFAWCSIPLGGEFDARVVKPRIAFDVTGPSRLRGPESFLGPDEPPGHGVGAWSRCGVHRR
ncbi:hypothetical protein Airi02_099530 [Actinoallomurus iriomotensis]|uniref:Uncharacterized protein n=1 Tax=Actinoallomurus iriomotensis TaxID=478107 RepID=A0A9W6SBX9_9ACTN|nr:hypothetical protein Airi02_099530 [Actinoallomurus iriomotensis]